ncbi:hypothetical protein N752_29720 [Desulforamulus aquiferis]|nr:hypothetical protein [Desulforamulus aquiferis]RYD01483.1 hypothetical protein N752_29720 [Desulforamulus aquiferis]
MAKARPGRRVEFRLPEEHPFFTVVPLGERQEWLSEIVSTALLQENVAKNKDPVRMILKLEDKMDQILSIMAGGLSVNQGTTPSSKQEHNPSKEGEFVAEKPKPAVKNQGPW